MGMNSIMLTKEGIQFSINFDQKKHVVKEVCVSYVVFDKIALQEQNNWRVQQFQLIARVRN